MNPTTADIVRQMLNEDGVDAERALVVLIDAIFSQHAEWDDRNGADTIIGDDGLQTWTGGAAAFAIMRYLNIASRDNLIIYEAQTRETEPAVSEKDHREGVACGELSVVQTTLMAIFDECFDRHEEMNNERIDEDEDVPPIEEAA